MIEQAKSFAEMAHKGQFRKISKEPYITHPIRVAERLDAAGCSAELISAAYLHDVVEDTPYIIEDIIARFGNDVASLVAAHTEDKTKTWKERKQHTIDTFANAQRDIKQLIVADRLDNLLDLQKDINQFGDTVWDYFNAGFLQQKWYNESIVKYMYQNINANDIPDFFLTFEKVVTQIFNDLPLQK